MVIGDEEDEVVEGVTDGGDGDAYKESFTSVDGFTRGANGRVKFNKDTKKRRREEEEADVEMGEPKLEPSVKKSKKPDSDARLGNEFKAKVSITHIFQAFPCANWISESWR